MQRDIRGEVISPYARWISTHEAAAILFVTPCQVCRLAKQGKLTYQAPLRSCPQQTGHFLREEVRALAAVSLRVQKAEGKICPETTFHEDEEWISKFEAAAMLNVHPTTILRMVRRGWLLARKDKQDLSQLHIVVAKRHVEMLAGRLQQIPHWREHREIRRQFPGRVSAIKDYRACAPEEEWLTASQIAEWLEVTKQRVSQWKKAGRLKAYPTPARRERGPGLWYRKVDVLAMLSEPSYQKWRNRWEKHHTPEAVLERASKRLEKEFAVFFGTDPGWNTWESMAQYHTPDIW